MELPESRTPAGSDPRASEERHGGHRDESRTLLLDLEEVASRLGISRAHAARLNASGRLPRPIHLGRSVRWNAQELERWTLAGCPARVRWEVIR